MDVRYRRLYHYLVRHGRECHAGLDDDDAMTPEQQQHRSDVRGLVFIFGTVITCLLLALAIMLWCVRPARAHDEAHPEHAEWYAKLMQPDHPRVPCCGESDAYWADVVHVRDGVAYATITDDRDDAPLRRHHVPMGKEIEVPNEKLKWDNGNPTGHAVIFLDINDYALCYVQGSGT